MTNGHAFPKLADTAEYQWKVTIELAGHDSETEAGVVLSETGRVTATLDALGRPDWCPGRPLDVLRRQLDAMVEALGKLQTVVPPSPENRVNLGPRLTAFDDPHAC